MTFDDLPLLLTAAEVSEVLRKGQRWPYDAVRSGTLRAIRIGRSLRFPRAELERLIQEGMADPAAASPPAAAGLAESG